MNQFTKDLKTLNKLLIIIIIIEVIIIKMNERVQWFIIKRHNHSSSHQLEDYINKEVWWIKYVFEFVEVYIFIYNGLNGGSFYEDDACLQVGSCMRIGFLTSQLDLRSTSWDLLWGLDSSFLSWIWELQDGSCNRDLGLS